MLFNTIEFVFFLPIVIILYYLLPLKFRWVLLLIASYYFYMCWKMEYVIFIFTSTSIDYYCGIQMGKKETKKARLPYLLFSLISNLGLLFTFKYANFFSTNINLLFNQFNLATQIPMFELLLPVGISFYTFQTLSYSVDVFHGRQESEKHFGYFALYVSFFPQLVAGPIERFSHLTPQLKEKHVFSYENLANGSRLILYGLFIKMVIADNLSGLVDSIYKAPQSYFALDILKGIFLYSFQIYSDFYGYSIIAVGSALIMGIQIMDNFKTPYLARNIADFWQRWHISLSTWFRDYIYFPMGGNRVSKLRWFWNVAVVFLVSGIWHGANWTFVTWGALFGFIYIVEKLINDVLKVRKDIKAYSFLHIILSLKTFVLVSLIWVFFRSQNFTEAITILKLAFTNFEGNFTAYTIPNTTLFVLGLFIISDVLLYNKRFDSWIGNFAFPIRWTIYSVLLFCIIVFAGVEDFPFIYFQF